MAATTIDPAAATVPGVEPAGSDVADMAARLEAPLTTLLTGGGDSRSTVDPVTGTNKYRCSPAPRPEVVPLGSCTASNVAGTGYAAAARALNRLRAVVDSGGLDDTIEEMARHLRSDIKYLMTHNELTELDAVLMPSGTDAELMACFVAAAGHDMPITNIVIGPTELGSGTTLAAACRYFDPLTPSGRVVEPGTPVDSVLAGRLEVYELPVRDAEGNARPVAALDGEVREVVSQRIERHGHRVLLHVTAHSKTGAHAPSLNEVAALKARYPDRLDVVVDAAQGRFSRRGLIRILRQGYLVITTGSKFFGGPPFAGALLLPRVFRARVSAAGALPAGFADFVCRSQLPVAWTAQRDGLPESVHNVGLVLRWCAALEEIRAYYASPSHLRLAVLRAFERLVLDIFQGSELIRADTVSAPIISDDFERLLQSKTTVFSFRLWRPDAGRFFNVEELRAIFGWMDTDLSAAIPGASLEQRRALAARLQIGQPVRLNSAGGQEVGVLRIANGGVLITRVAEDLDLGRTLDARIGWLEDQLLSAKRKLEAAAEHFARIQDYLGHEP